MNLRTFDLKDFFALMAFLCICLPYLSITGIHATDIKLDALAWVCFFLILSFSAILNGLFERKFPWPLCFFAFLVLYALFIDFMNGEINYRALGAYISICLFAIFAFLGRPYYRLYARIVIICAILIGIVALAQVNIDRNIGIIFFDRFRSSPNRGVTSLTNEPSFYGNLCLFYLFALYLLPEPFENRPSIRRCVAIFLCLQLFLFSRSIAPILGFFLFGFSHLVFVNNWTSRVITVLCGGVLLFLLRVYALVFKTDRLGYLINRFIDNPLSAIKMDESIEMRFADVFYSIMAFFYQIPVFVGHGLDEWSRFQIEFISRLDHQPLTIFFTNVVKSGHGTAIFQLGILGAMLPLVCFWCFVLTRSNRFKIVGLTLAIYMFSTIPLAYPFYGFLMGIALARSQKDFSDY